MAIASGRWAVILKQNADGQAEVADIKIMEGVKPELNVDAADRYELEEVEDGVKIGMVRGGKVGAVGGFGFQDELSAAGRSEAGVTRIADTKATARDEASLPPVSHEKQRGTEAPAQSQASGETATEKPAPRARRKSQAKKKAA